MKRFLLSTIGSRGDVQPLVALATALRELGAEPRLCVPPDFREWIVGLGFHVDTIGPELRQTAKPATPRTPEQLRQLMEETVATQFATIEQAARGCDAVVGATALQIAAPSIAQALGIPYVFAAYCPAVVPSRHHAPPVLTIRGDAPAPAASDYSALWAQDARRWNDHWSGLLAPHRARLGLPAIDDVRGCVLTSRPWLAADPALAPWPAGNDGAWQTGAWILADERPLSAELVAFLDAGEPPVYFGFGSIRAPVELARTVIEAARAHGRRVIVSRGWADLRPVDDAADCLAIGEVNQQALFPRLAAVVHHGGAGTTTAAARAGAPQVVIPQHYDQFYFAQRVDELSLGKSVSRDVSFVDALGTALAADVRMHARKFASSIVLDGAYRAAAQLMRH